MNGNRGRKTRQMYAAYMRYTRGSLCTKRIKKKTSSGDNLQPPIKPPRTVVRGHGCRTPTAQKSTKYTEDGKKELAPSTGRTTPPPAESHRGKSRACTQQAQLATLNAVAATGRNLTEAHSTKTRRSNERVCTCSPPPPPSPTSRDGAPLIPLPYGPTSPTMRLNSTRSPCRTACVRAR